MNVQVAVCRKCKGHAKLIRLLRSDKCAVVNTVGCQKICHGPVVGLPVEGRMEWFERVGKPKSKSALSKLIAKGGAWTLPTSLEKRRVVRRSGRPPR